jgi:hypothetical protein
LKYATKFLNDLRTSAAVPPKPKLAANAEKSVAMNPIRIGRWAALPAGDGCDSPGDGLSNGTDRRVLDAPTCGNSVDAIPPAFCPWAAVGVDAASLDGI